MTDYKVERLLGYTPCVCGNLDGAWHPTCYWGLTKEQIDAGYKRAFAAARRHIKAQVLTDAERIIDTAQEKP